MERQCIIVRWVDSAVLLVFYLEAGHLKSDEMQAMGKKFINKKERKKEHHEEIRLFFFFLQKLFLYYQQATNKNFNWRLF